MAGALTSALLAGHLADQRVEEVVHRHGGGDHVLLRGDPDDAIQRLAIGLGADCVSNSTTDVWPVAVLLGFVLGPMPEEHFRRAM